jgi:heparosan-N-sulfate-glucuronate 5-epimerase
MPKREIFYYINTLKMRAIALSINVLDKVELMRDYKEKQKKRYATYADQLKIPANIKPHFLNTQYVTYLYLPTAADYERHILFDRDGVAMCRNDVKIIYNPLICAHFALVCYNDFLKYNNTHSLEKFWTQVRHLDRKKPDDNGARIYRYDTEVPAYDLKAGFYAGIAQAAIASVFARAYYLTQDAAWKVAAKQTLDAFFIPITEGGVFTKTPEGYDWVEEYPSPTRRSYVLNGFIFCLVALYEYTKLCDATVFKNDLNNLEKSLFATLHEYTFGKYVKYGRHMYIFQNIEYHGLMACQFAHLFSLTGSEAYRQLTIEFNGRVDWKAFFRFYDSPMPDGFKVI